MATQAQINGLVQLYVGYFNRAPDPAGLTYWINELDNNPDMTFADIANSFSVQPEATGLYGYLTNPGFASPTAFITAIYGNLFNRAPDAEGLAYWEGELAGGKAPGQMIIDIMSGAIGDDRTILDNKTAAALDYTASVVNVPGFTYEGNAAAATAAADVLDGVDATPESVTAAAEEVAAYVATISGGDTGGGTGGGTGGAAGDIELTVGNPFTGEVFDDLTGTAGDDNFHAESGTFTSGDKINGGAGNDTLTFINEEFDVAVNARVTGVENFIVTNQVNDNNNGSNNNIDNFNQDVEIDAGRMLGTTRWENYDSRADVIIEDARDIESNDNDTQDSDGTFTGDQTVAMVSTDPGNVDYAVYFDDPQATSNNNDSIFIEVIDQNNSSAFSAAAITATTPGNLTDAQLTQFKFVYNGEEVTVMVPGTDHFGPTATYTDLVTAIQAGLDATELADGTFVGADITAELSSAFDENIGDDNAGEGTNANVFGLRVVLSSASNAELGDAGAGDITVISSNDPADTAQSITTLPNVTEELIRVNAILDDVGKGSTGGDLLIGAMSTGRQDGSQGTSDSQGIQQFDIMVDRDSNVQTINSTNNALEVVNITNGDNNRDSNTTAIGDLVVRGRSPNDGTSDNVFPGAEPQHNSFGFDDVRVLNASAMVGSVDLTANLTSSIIEKYLMVEDTQGNGNADDITFDYDLGTNNDALFVKIDDDAAGLAGTGGREDFVMTVDGNAGNDEITTMVGNAVKALDGQGRDYYNVNTGDTTWYANQTARDSASFEVNGGSGDDTIWTYGAGNNTIRDGSGSDAVYADNSGVRSFDGVAAAYGINANGVNSLESAFNGDENMQIDHFAGAMWSFNDTNQGNGLTNFHGDNEGANNEAIVAATADNVRVAGTAYTTELTVSYFGAGGSANANTAYTSTVTIADSLIAANGTVRDQQINQAIKRAINNDETLNDLLEAVDAAGQSLFVYSKTDGAFVQGDLTISLTEKSTVAGATTETDFSADANFAKAYGTAGAETDFGTLGASLVESDNRLVQSADGANDTLVLGTGAASNDVVAYGDGQFGNDTVLNFMVGDGAAGFAAGTGGDAFDFTAITYAQVAANFSQGAANQLNNSVSILAEANTAAAAGALTNNTTAAKVADLYDGAADADGVATTTNHIVIVYDDNANGNAVQPVVPTDDWLFDSENNTGTVYLVTDTDGANATATALGDIDLIGTDWATLTFDNFA